MAPQAEAGPPTALAGEVPRKVRDVTATIRL